MQRFLYLQQHRKCLYQGISCVFLFVFFGLLIQMSTLSVSSFVFKSRLLVSGITVALSMTLWNYTKGYIIAFIFYTGIFLSSAFVPMLVGQHVERAEIIAAYLLGSMAFLFLTDLLYLNRHISLKVMRRLSNGILYFCLLSALLMPLIIWGYYAVSGRVLSATIVLTLFQTNGSESLAYLKSQNLVSWVGTLVILVFVLGGTTYFLHRLAVPSLSFPKKTAVLLSLFILGVSSHTIVKGTDYLPVRIARETTDSLQQYKAYGKAKAQRASRLQQLKGLHIESAGGVFILVIGESETRDHMQAYGYDRDTTPWLMEVSRQPGAILFRNAYSNHTHTVPVLTYALSEKNQYNDISLEKAYSLIEIAKAAGYDTYWISNQRKYGAWDTPVAEMASTATHQIWMNERAGTHDLRSDHYDEDLVDALPDSRDVKNALIVIHLMGNHGAYTDRYPVGWKHYSGESKSVDAYDDAARYNDYVLQTLYDKLKDNPNFKGFVYFSDHGEDVEKNYGHEASKFTATMSHIPLFMILSPSFQAERPQTVQSLQSHRESYWTNDLIYNLMTDLMGIEGVPGSDPDWDLASTEYSMSKGNLRTLHNKTPLPE